MDFRIQVPAEAQSIIDCLTRSGYAAFVVGGCVRDSIIGIEPKDWDICTSALPHQVKACLPPQYHTIDTGLKHGTITVLCRNEEQYEVTTYRVDGVYSDNRHPDKVEFVDSLAEDLSRRDFTINAMAYNTQVGLIDLYGGLYDIGICVLRCVGSPEKRFEEDALRILRALRFASTYGLLIEKETAAAIHANAWRLKNIAAERINVELCRMLCGRNVRDILLDYSDVIATIIPEIKPCIGFKQNNKYHQYTVYDHIAHAVANYPGDDVSIKVALLLHDIGKPQCYTEDENGGHFYGHAEPSYELAKTVVDRLKFDNDRKKEILELVRYHDVVIEPTPKTIRRWLNKLGEDRMYQLMEVRLADIKAHAEGTQGSRIKRRNAVCDLLDKIIEERQCFSMKDLAVNGTDIMSIGVPEGKQVGQILHTLLDMVMADELKNNHDELLAFAGRIWDEVK